MSMFGSTGANFVSPTEISNVVGRVGGSTIVVSALKSFNTELLTLLADFYDPDKDMIVNGVKIAAADKYQTAAVALINYRMDEINTQTTELNNLYFAIVNLEKRLNV